MEQSLEFTKAPIKGNINNTYKHVTTVRVLVNGPPFRLSICTSLPIMVVPLLPVSTLESFDNIVDVAGACFCCLCM